MSYESALLAQERHRTAIDRATEFLNNKCVYYPIPEKSKSAIENYDAIAKYRDRHARLVARYLNLNNKPFKKENVQPKQYRDIHA